MRELSQNHPWLATTIGVGLLGMLLALSGQQLSTRWVFALYALVVVAVQVANMIMRKHDGHLGFRILVVSAIVATLLMNEYVAAMTIILMLTAGRALKDYVSRRTMADFLAPAPQVGRN